VLHHKSRDTANLVCSKAAIGHKRHRIQPELATYRSRCTWMCGGSPRSELKKMKLYGPSRRVLVPFNSKRMGWRRFLPRISPAL
jgi:hypothetical protein